jgi:hypothetical protein
MFLPTVSRRKQGLRSHDRIGIIFRTRGRGKLPNGLKQIERLTNALSAVLEAGQCGWVFKHRKPAQQRMNSMYRLLGFCIQNNKMLDD